MIAKTKNRKTRKEKRSFGFLLMLAAIFMVVITGTFTVISGIKPDEAFEKVANQLFEPEIPEKYIPLYQEAADEYKIPWTLLAAHHRVETKFSSMDPLLSPVGAEGHLQFMPCTFVGWEHPTCTGLGQGEIRESEKTDPVVIEKYGGYGVDGNGDGVADPYNLTDALHSAANYLSRNGAATGELEHAIFDYNQSEEYVEEVLFFYEKYENQLRQ
ncbi:MULTISPECIES: lytic transglycosylase domain-containing protein [Planococcus]|uniref:lytic transglycosylase domain-containing protein n=1 Tax=Planococcus TaxID=1372 RepID=UPI001FD0CEC9|nr:lytic transglycosylase domain-containing protein [Planococcus soli]